MLGYSDCLPVIDGFFRETQEVAVDILIERGRYFCRLEANSVRFFRSSDSYNVHPLQFEVRQTGSIIHSLVNQSVLEWNPPVYHLPRVDTTVYIRNNRTTTIRLTILSLRGHPLHCGQNFRNFIGISDNISINLELYLNGIEDVSFRDGIYFGSNVQIIPCRIDIFFQ